MARKFLKWLPIVSVTLIVGAMIVKSVTKEDNTPELEKVIR